MPTSPNVNFTFNNENVQVSTPALGVTTVVAITTKGPSSQPSEIISSYKRFQEVYGFEVVPDGSVSNIQRALSLGSKIRVSRVPGAGTPVYGVAKDKPETGPAVTTSSMVVNIYDPLHEEGIDQTPITVSFGISTKEPGSSIVEPSTVSSNKNFYLRVHSSTVGGVVKYYLSQSKSYKNSTDELVDMLNPSQLMLTTSTLTSINTFTDTSILQLFIETVPNIKFTNASENLQGWTTIQDVINFLKSNPTYYTSINFGIQPEVGKNLSHTMVINEGIYGTTPTATEWLEAYKASREFTDSYQVILSHIHQHMVGDTYMTAYQTVAENVSRNFENILYVEIPKKKVDGTVYTVEELVTLQSQMLETIGADKAIAYFCGGVKFYNSSGVQQDNDILGTVIGLGDTAATEYGPWYSFSGMNRGLITDSQGPVMANLGSPSMYDELNKLAAESLNLVVVKNTPAAGTQAMLWHGFTSELMNNSNRFLASTRLQLYLKKTIRPIIEKYLEEPNFIPTWNRIYYEVKPILDSLLSTAIESYTWNGDQFATSYNDLQINNEADVRQGKYKAKLSYSDIVPMQVVDIEFSIDTATGDVSIQ